MIGILNYGMGNLRSVHNALDYLGCESKIINTPDELSGCERLIIPGVGAYQKAVDNIKELKLWKPLNDFKDSGKPILGICLGMQLLSTIGNEPVRCEGLGFILGEVQMLTPAESLPLPHVGWNNLTLVNSHPIFEGIKRTVDFYFVHSYHFVPEREDAVITTTDYTGVFVSSIAHENIVGVQFHPEKSQENGLRLLENFSTWEGVC